jgi:polyisoprenoid-binding protein YceI
MGAYAHAPPATAGIGRMHPAPAGTLTMKRKIQTLCAMRFAIICMLAAVSLPLVARAQAPVYEIAQEGGSIKFHLKASVALAGKFDSWDAALTFTSAEETTRVLSITIQAESVDTGSGMKNGKLKGKDFFEV